MVLDQVRVNPFIREDMFIKDNILEIKNLERVSFVGAMEMYMKETGRIISDME